MFEHKSASNSGTISGSKIISPHPLPCISYNNYIAWVKVFRTASLKLSSKNRRRRNSQVLVAQGILARCRLFRIVRVKHGTDCLSRHRLSAELSLVFSFWYFSWFIPVRCLVFGKISFDFCKICQKNIYLCNENKASDMQELYSKKNYNYPPITLFLSHKCCC